MVKHFNTKVHLSKTGKEIEITILAKKSIPFFLSLQESISDRPQKQLLKEKYPTLLPFFSFLISLKNHRVPELALILATIPQFDSGIPEFFLESVPLAVCWLMLRLRARACARFCSDSAAKLDRKLPGKRTFLEVLPCWLPCLASLAYEMQDANSAKC